jgi:signal transduction histidine kinase
MIALYATIVFSLIAYLVIFIIGRRIKILHEREVLLTKLVDQKTIDLRAAIEKTEKLLETSEKTNRLLEEATQQKSHMLSVASHDLKNPLQSIIGFSEILQDELENPEMKNMAGIIISSSRDMLKQINEILDAAAIESKNLKLNLKKVSVNEVVKEIIKNNNFRARQKKQILEISLMDNNYVIADDHWLKIALDNVVNNAIKYSPTEKHILVSTQRVNGNVLIRIKDEGQGLTNEDLEKMFRRYQRLSAKPTGGESSTGLGLSIVKDIIDLHNGKIWAVKNPADGAEFIIQLPADPDA